MKGEKLRLICRKLRLAPGEYLLDVGWGGLARFAARELGARMLRITLSLASRPLAGGGHELPWMSADLYR